jgi:hypothetical protein
LKVTLEYRFLNFLFIQPFEGARRVFIRLWKGAQGTPRRDTLTDLTRLLEARYLVAERAYFHHAKIISGAMLGRAFQEASLSEGVSEHDLYGETDDTLVRKLASSKVPSVARMGGALLERRLHKRLHRYSELDFSGTQEHDHSENPIDRALGTLSKPDRRRLLEDRIAEEVGARSGDVLIYAPPKKMNMKVAEMLVVWKGRPTKLNAIDDPVIRPRLDQILEAHKLLWGIHLVVAPEMSARQRTLVREACDIELTTPAALRADYLKQHYQKLVEQRLVEQKLEIPRKADEYALKLAQAADDLVATARDNKSWRERLDAVVRSHFPPANA